MGLSVIQEQQQILLDTIKNITRGDWKVLVLDEATKKLVDNVVKEDDILNENIANIELIEQRRDKNPTMDAIYILSPQPHIVDCLMADLERRRYRRAFLVWTSVLDPQLRKRVEMDSTARQLIAGFETLSVDFFPRESHLVTFRDPWSFPILYHPDCNGLVRPHMEILAQKIAGVCISLGEYPRVRYYKPRDPLHEASVLSMHLARFVQEQLDNYARWNQDFPPPSTRPHSVLVVTDRSMDVMAPLVHEFTYQAMAHDLLPIKDNDKTTFHMTINEGADDAEEKDMELHEKDSVWVDNRHRHMKDTIDKLMGDFQKFIDQNPHFANQTGDGDGKGASLNTIKDMLAGLPQFQEMKEAYTLHLTMAQECMSKFQHQKLPDVASAEQSLATGLDEDYRKPRNILDQVVRLLDDEAITPEDRLRLIMLYVLYRDGVIPDDVKRLLAHAGLPPNKFEAIVNLELLGGRPVRNGLKDVRPAPTPLFPVDPKALAQSGASEEYALSRFQPALNRMLEALCSGQLDQTVFPYVQPPMDGSDGVDSLAGPGSLRAAKPNWAWAGSNRPARDNQQRVFVFMAGGATFSEARTCYEASAKYNREVVLATSHMMTPHMFLRQVGDLSANYRQLDIPLARPKPKAPAHLFEREQPAPPPKAPSSMLPPGGPAAAGGRKPGMAGRAPVPAAAAAAAAGIPGGPRPPTKQMGQMSLGGSSSGGGSVGGNRYNAPSTTSSGVSSSAGEGGKLHKLDKEKRKRNIFGLKK